jgi:catechol 2,3-dioxygenase-like lactoylglutathione lyase family enzyme
MLMVNVQLNHTIVWCRDKRASAAFITQLLGLPAATPFGQMLVVKLGNGVSLDYFDSDDKIAMQHYAFLMDEDTFDDVFARVRERGLRYWADPGKQRTGETYVHNGGRGLYFDDPDGHLLEIMTQPYEGSR